MLSPRLFLCLSLLVSMTGYLMTVRASRLDETQWNRGRLSAVKFSFRLAVLRLRSSNKAYKTFKVERGMLSHSKGFDVLRKMLNVKGGLVSSAPLPHWDTI